MKRARQKEEAKKLAKDIRRYLKFGKYTKDCPKNLLDKVKKIKKAESQRDYIIKILKVIREEFNPKKYKTITTKDFKKSRFISVKTILRKRQRSCGSLATVVSSVLRNLGIPTKLIHGFYIKEKPDMRHAWNEVYLKGRWVPFDITRKDFKIGKFHIKKEEWVDWADLERVYKKLKDRKGERGPNKLLKMVYRKTKAGSHFLDLGCGQGRDSLSMAKKGFKVTAVDKSQEGLFELKRLLKEWKLQDQVRIVCQDIQNFKIKKNQYDIINIIHCLHLLKKKNSLKIIKEIKDDLRNNGFVIISAFTTKDPGFKKRRGQSKGFFQPQELKNLFSDFKIIFYKESLINDLGHPGFPKPHQHHLAQLIAQKII